MCAGPGVVDVETPYGASTVTGERMCRGGECVEIADAGTTVLIRDSGRPDAAVLDVPTAQWTAFVRMAAHD